MLFVLVTSFLLLSSSLAFRERLASWRRKWSSDCNCSRPSKLCRLTQRRDQPSLRREKMVGRAVKKSVIFSLENETIPRDGQPKKNSLTKMPTTLYEEQNVKKSIGNCQDMQTVLFVSVMVWRANCMKSYRKLTRYANLVVRFSLGMESKLYANP